MTTTGMIADLAARIARPHATVVAVSKTVPTERLREPPEFTGQYDPHIWFDVALWTDTIDAMLPAIVGLDPANAAPYTRNAAELRSELEELDGWVERRIAELPEDRRILVTAHDAFGYFGVRYGVQVAGLQDVERVVDLVIDRKVKAIFVESGVPGESMNEVSNPLSFRSGGNAASPRHPHHGRDDGGRAHGDHPDLLSDRLGWMLALSVVLGVISAVAGYGLARVLDASIAGAIATVTGAVFLLSPKYGLLARLVRERRGGRAKRNPGPKSWFSATR